MGVRCDGSTVFAVFVAFILCVLILTPHFAISEITIYTVTFRNY